MILRKRPGAALSLLLCSLVLCAATVLPGCGRARSGRPPDVVLIVVDTLRADRLGALRGGEALTPFLDQLARRGTRFTRAYSTSSWTLPAVASLFTSRTQSQHGITHIRSTLASTEHTLAERLAEAGYRCVGFSANPLVGKGRGYGQGFDVWRLFPGKQFDPDGRPLVRASFLRERIVEGLDDGKARAGAPLCLYAQLMEPHSPYDPPAELYARFLPAGHDAADAAEANRKLRAFRFDAISDDEVELLRALYDAEVAYADAELRRLFDQLATRIRLDEAIVIVTSDHGEEFREHDWLIHGLTLFEESVRIPLIVVGPGVPAGHVVSEPVSLLDLAPTVLELAGLAPEERFQGRSLVALMRDDSATEGREIVLELASKQEPVDIRLHTNGIVQDDTKIVIAPTGATALFDLAVDPGERHPLDPAKDPKGAGLLASLMRLRSEATAAQGGGALRPALSEAERAELHALGYVPDPAPEAGD